MRKLPPKKFRNEKQNLIIKAVQDFFGEGASNKMKKSISKISLYLMGRKARLGALTEEENEALWYIRENLKDKTYSSTFLKPLFPSLF